MESFVSNQVGRTIVLKNVQGEDLLESIEAAIKAESIENAVIVSGIATLDQSRLHMISTLGYPIVIYIDEKTDFPLEVVSVDGFICEGEPPHPCDNF